jgi:hypothetical protein
LQATQEFPTAVKCQIILHDCAPETPSDSVDAEEVADNYIVSDYRNIVKDDEEGVVFTLETMEYHVAEESLLSE